MEKCRSMSPMVVGRGGGDNGYISDDRPSNDRTTDCRPHIIALFLIAPCKPTSLFHRTDVTDSRSMKEQVRSIAKLSPSQSSLNSVDWTELVYDGNLG